MSRIAFPLVAAAFMALAAGCGEVPEQTFLPRGEVTTLVEPAQEEVTEVMLTSFGQPLAPVLWEKLPVRYHAAKGEAAVESEDAPTRLAVELSYLTMPVEAGQNVVWVLGPNVGATRKVVSFEPDFEPEDVEETLADGGTLDGVLVIDQPLPFEVDGEEICISPGAMMQKGRPLYARHCQHCHGVGGDGNGPTAYSMNPKPRDYRQGLFKFTSTHSGKKVSRSDLMKVLNEGIAGTYMPSFKLMPADDKRAIIEYVLWLAQRGEVEYGFVRTLAADFTQEDWAEEDPADLEEEWGDFTLREDGDPSDFDGEFSDTADFVASSWAAAEFPNAVVTPKIARTEPTPESIERGRRIYLSDGAKCVSCHGESGAGNGPQTIAYNKDERNEFYPEPGLYDEWGQPIKPRNLLTGQWRGGRRPIDLYRRVHAGIKGSKMPAFGGSLSEEQIWDLVNFLIVLPEQPELLPGEAPSSEGPKEVAAVSRE